MQAKMILTNGRIYTVDPEMPWAQAVACGENGRILAVGTNDEIEALTDANTEWIDAAGRLVLPGFIDSHIHFLQYAIRRNQVSLFDVADFDEVMRLVQTAVSQAEPGQWVTGWGWNENLWGGIQPTAQLLDAISPNNPVALARMDMHSWWVNQNALDIANINADTPDPEESTIERDGNGRPNGILREWNAIGLVESKIPPIPFDTLRCWMKETIADMHQHGITGVHDQRVEREGAESFQLWQSLQRQDELNLRVHMHISSDYLDEAVTLGLQPGFGNDRLWIGHVKAFADGSMGSRTAHMLQPFANEPDNRGIVVTSVAELWQLAVRAGEAGFPLSVHAIGDRAVREVLDVFNEHLSTPQGQKLTLPHRIEHVQLLHPDDIARLQHPGIVASMQSIHIHADWQTADEVWGDRARYTYAFRSLLDSGARLTLGSDAPVAPINVMWGLFTAVNRTDLKGLPAEGWYPEEKISMAEAIHAYSMGPAIVSGKQTLQGSITPGKWADMIILSQNLFEISPEAILETEVDVTIFAGKIVHQPGEK